MAMSSTAPELFDLPAIPKRGKHYVKPNGYASQPGTGPDGETCGTCKHLTQFEQSKRWHKCRLTEQCWTHGRASDVLVRSPACRFWEAA